MGTHLIGFTYPLIIIIIWSATPSLNPFTCTSAFWYSVPIFQQRKRKDYYHSAQYSTVASATSKSIVACSPPHSIGGACIPSVIISTVNEPPRLDGSPHTPRSSVVVPWCNMRCCAAHTSQGCHQILGMMQPYIDGDGTPFLCLCPRTIRYVEHTLNPPRHVSTDFARFSVLLLQNMMTLMAAL